MKLAIEATNAVDLEAGIQAGASVSSKVGEAAFAARAQLTDRLGGLLALEKGDRVLEIGCGAGRATIQIANTFGVQAVGVDVSKNAIRNAIAAAKDLEALGKVQFRAEDAAVLPFAPASFDAAFCERCLYEFEDLEPVVSELARSLKPRGRLAVFDVYLESPNVAGLPSLLVALDLPRRPLTRRRLCSIFRKNGLEPVETVHCSQALKKRVQQVSGMQCRDPMSDASRACEAIESGEIGYGILVFERAEETLAGNDGDAVDHLSAAGEGI